jgi:hypothetical protein
MGRLERATAPMAAPPTVSLSHNRHVLTPPSLMESLSRTEVIGAFSPMWSHQPPMGRVGVSLREGAV